MWDADLPLVPEFERLLQRTGPLDLFDAHTHVGANDPDGFAQTPGELLAQLDVARARGVVFPMHEPEGYTAANDAVLAVAGDSGGRVVAFCRVDPKRADAVAEARRCLDRGARGIKLHPRAERFGMDEPAIRGLAALAHERRVPILVHAGRGIPALGLYTTRYARELPDARFILAHAAISDLSWLRRELPALPNVFIDTAWWNACDLMALFTLVSARHVLYASDSPYSSPLHAAVLVLRCALQAGCSQEQIAAVTGGQLERLLSGGDSLDVGAAAGEQAPLHPVLERVAAYLLATIGSAFAGADYAETLALARLACDPDADDGAGPASQHVLELLDAFQRGIEAPLRPGRPLPEAGRLLVAALAVARTPDAG